MLGKLHAVASEAINVWGFVEFAAVTGEIGPAKIVCEDKDDVGMGGGKHGKANGEEKAEDQSFEVR